MRRTGIFGISAMALLVFALACGDDSGTTKKDKGGVKLDGGGKEASVSDSGPGNEGVTKVDMSKQEASLPKEGGTGDALPTCDAKILGKACTPSGSECGNDATCLLTTSTKGLCVCACTPDNSKTALINEDTCPGATTTKQSVCGSLSVTTSTGTATKSFCFLTCKPTLGSNTCPTGIACSPRSGPQVGIFDQAVCLYSGCTKNSDCSVFTGNFCDIKDTTKSCPTGETCEAMLDSTGKWATVGVCQKDGVCDTKSGLCGKHTLGKSTAKVGDACKSDLECGNNMSCMFEWDEAKYMKASNVACTTDSECCSGSCSSGKCADGEPCTMNNRNGYCIISGCAFATTLTDFACDSGSYCNTLYSGGLCQKKCDLKTATTCRGNTNDKFGDYECRSWDNLMIGAKKITDGPVCDFGPQMSCDILKNSKLDCSAVGDATNTTSMSCRDMKNTKLTNSYDPKGWCFDDTASGN